MTDLEMTDLEMTKLCAEAMELKFPNPWVAHAHGYDPLHNDVQAMALVKNFDLMIAPRLPQRNNQWFVSPGIIGINGKSEDLNRAIVECVAKMQEKK